MDAFSGKWESSGKLATGLDAFLAGIGQSALKESFEKKHTYDIKISGDQITIGVNKDGCAPVSNTVKIGERSEITLPDVGKIFATLSFKGDILVNTQEMAGLTMVSEARNVNGDMVVTITCKGHSMTARYIRG